MSTSGSDYHFQFEIAIVLVLGLLIYVFVSLAMVAGYHLWNISSKVDTVRLKQQQQDYNSQPSNSQQNVPAAVSRNADYSSEGNRNLDGDLRKNTQELNNTIRECNNEKDKNSRYHSTVTQACIALEKIVRRYEKAVLEADKVHPDNNALKEELREMRELKNVTGNLDAILRKN